MGEHLLAVFERVVKVFLDEADLAAHRLRLGAGLKAARAEQQRHQLAAVIIGLRADDRQAPVVRLQLRLEPEGDFPAPDDADQGAAAHRLRQKRPGGRGEGVVNHGDDEPLAVCAGEELRAGALLRAVGDGERRAARDLRLSRLNPLGQRLPEDPVLQDADGEMDRVIKKVHLLGKIKANHIFPLLKIYFYIIFFILL